MISVFSQLEFTFQSQQWKNLSNVWNLFKGNTKVNRRTSLTLSWRRPLSYRNQSIDFLSKSMDWFLYVNGLRHERVKWIVFYFKSQDNGCNFSHAMNLLYTVHEKKRQIEVGLKWKNKCINLRKSKSQWMIQFHNILLKAINAIQKYV